MKFDVLGSENMRNDWITLTESVEILNLRLRDRPNSIFQNVRIFFQTIKRKQSHFYYSGAHIHPYRIRFWTDVLNSTNEHQLLSWVKKFPIPSIKVQPSKKFDWFVETTQNMPAIAKSVPTPNSPVLRNKARKVSHN